YRIAVGTQFGMLQPLRLIDLRVDPPKAALQLASGRTITTVQADHGGDITVQVDHAPATRSGVQPIDVLSNHSAQSGCFQIGQGSMSGIRPRLADAMPTEIRASPIALLRVCGADELAELHGSGTDRGGPSIVWDSRVGRHPGAGERDPSTSAKQICGRGNGGGSCHCHAKNRTCAICSAKLS